MTRDSVLFRVDAGKEVGWEGLSRCLTIAAALQRRRRASHFLARLEPNTLLSQVRRGDNTWIPADAPVGMAADLEEMILEIRRLRPAAVVIDSAQCGPEYLAELTSLGPLIVSIDSGSPHKFACQLVVHPLLNKACAEYDVSPGTQVLAGQRYAIVRPGIRRIRPLRGQEPPEPFRVVITLGDDPGNWTLRAAKALLQVNRLSRVDILARAGHPKLPAWQSFAESHKDKVTVALETAEMAKRISRCHLAVTEADTGALELACVGVPLLTLVQDEVYWNTAARLEEEGAATNLGLASALKESAIRMAVENLLDDQSERRLMARCGRGLIDGRGPDRFITALEILLHPMRRMDLLQDAA